MSTDITFEHLYTLIKDNHVDGLGDVIFFLRARIHVLKICYGLTPMLYAAKLGHMEQVKILFYDLERYGLKKSSVLEKVYDLWIYLISPEAKSFRDLDFVQNLTDSYTRYLLIRNMQFGEGRDYDSVNAVLRHLVDKEAYDVLDHFIHKHGEHYINKLVDLSFRRLIPMRHLPDWIRTNNTRYDNKIEEWRHKDRLLHALILEDTKKVIRIIPRFLANPKEEIYLLASEDVLHQPHNLDIYLPNRGEYLPKMLLFIIITDNIQILEFLFTDENLEKFLKLCKVTKEELIETVMEIAVAEQSLKIVQFVLGTPLKIQNPKMDWTFWYCYSKLEGKDKSVDAIRHLRKPMSEHTINKLYRAFQPDLEEHPMSKASCEACVEVLGEMHDYMHSNRSYEKTFPKFLRELRQFPIKYNRPDLVAPFKKYEIDYKDSVVFTKTNRGLFETDCNYENQYNRDTNELIWEQERGASSTGLPTMLTRRRLAEAYLCFGSGPVYLIERSLWKPTKSCLLERSIKESGRKLIKYVPIVGDEKEDPDTREQRQAAMTLQKRCRLKIRECMDMLQRKPDSVPRVIIPLMVRAQRLYVEGHLPKRLVDYVLYRENFGTERPLYYSLMELSDEWFHHF